MEISVTINASSALPMWRRIASDRSVGSGVDSFRICDPPQLHRVELMWWCARIFSRGIHVRKCSRLCGARGPSGRTERFGAGSAAVLIVAIAVIKGHPH
ncbi:hypothetical protein NP284_07805 [Rhodopseudomonas pseudopalustris]|uniref:hypothetical protein n=1 Tax=Rhodopseudomonas pseudopalustris TaxID=1513892 RepID=UPI003F952FD4